MYVKCCVADELFKDKSFFFDASGITETGNKTLDRKIDSGWCLIRVTILRGFFLLTIVEPFG